MIRILIGDDHELFRDGVRRIVEEETDMRVVSEAADGPEVVNLISKHKPDVVVLDISMPGRSGLDVLKELKERWPRLPVLMLSMHPEERFAIRAIRAGASGYVCKKSASSELVNAIRKAHSGGRYITASVADQLAADIDAASTQAPHTLLSDREFQILVSIAAGKPTRDIAAELSVSAVTVKTYRARLLAKLRLKSNAEVIRYALEHHLAD